MSFWTHVNGSLRVDSLTGDMRNLFRTVGFWGKDEEWEACNVPCGSEGSLDISIWYNPQPNDASRYTINFFGDLRGFEEDEQPEIIEWLDNLIKDNNMIIRGGIVTINKKTYRYFEHIDENWDVVKQGFELIHTESRADVL